MEENKQKFALWAYPDTLNAVEKLYRQDNCRSKSEFIEKALHFYIGYICSADKSDYLPHIVVSTMQGTMDAFEDRIAGLLFKMAVELSMLLHVTAAANEIDEDTLSRLRGISSRPDGQRKESVAETGYHCQGFVSLPQHS